MISLIKNIKYTPTEQDLIHVSTIREFLQSEEIPFVEDSEVFGLFCVNDIKGNKIEIRYIDSYFFPIDNSKRFGEKCKGVDKNYFVDISHENFNNNIRTIWIYDFEIEQVNDNVQLWKGDKGYHRQWEVIKNTIRTACGKIRHRFYARDCEVREIGNDLLRPFLSTNCFYGYRSATVNLGLFLKKDKNGFKKDTLLEVLTFGNCFYGNKKKQENPEVEIIRASTTIGCQVVGGMSKLLRYFCENYPTLTIGSGDKRRTIEVNTLTFFVDASHNDGRGMGNSALNFTFESWQGCGFKNRWTCDYTSEDGRLRGKRGEIFERKPMFHKQIMQLIGEGKIVSIANAGTIVYYIDRQEYLDRFKQ